MRYAIFSDIHANLEAFQAVIHSYQQENIDVYLCLGDIVGYGVDYAQCIRRLKELKAIAIAGNHEWGVCGKSALENFTTLTQAAVVWTSQRLKPEESGFLGSLPLVYNAEDFVLVHSSLETPEKFYYLNNYDEAANTFHLLKKSLCFVGHTHKPGVYIEGGDKIMFSSCANLPRDIRLEADKRYIINVGSVGQPRDRDNRASFAIYDSQDKLVQIKRVDYDLESAQRKILEAGLPEELALRLAEGR